MKTKFTFTLALLLCTFATFAQSSCPSFFRRNNGNGTCPDGQLKLYFATCPAVVPVIDSVYTDGVKQNVSFYLPDVSKCASQGYFSYCVAGGNLPPSSTWVIYFHSTSFTNGYGCTISEGGPLPVKYASFDALTVDKKVTLSWVTDAETNNHHFEVERSFDGTSFTNIGLVLDGFANGSQKKYQFKDNARELQSADVAYYRLKQIDNDYKASYSNTLLVRLNSKNAMTVQTTPNPFTESVNINFSSTESGNVLVNIISLTGQKLFTKIATVNKGNNSIQVAGLGKLTPGMYLVQLNMNGTVTGSQKIIKY